MSFNKFSLFKLFDLPFRKIICIFGAEDEGRLTPCEDDKPETVRQRLSVYHSKTEALKGFYEKLGKLRLVEGNQPIEDATRDILAALGV